ncbi:DUF4129 domain-containing protein [Paludifilum halophilum]|uniref:Protein-glutamine gamma-glutamyltransferase-like C-terminal domain-containing protein n=1 Tax=Paludifilum halophilum TaxID=1642702 RepID=A0A235BBA7_9BACL|nr:DUF4129 domain-containing protein [Paludifilum halophilum]OYD09573.1 hypothetical protein CHM34_00730 [Paludifilum halophilum]
MTPDYREARKQLSEILEEEEFSQQEQLQGWLEKVGSLFHSLDEGVQRWLESMLGVEDPRLGWFFPLLMATLLGFLLWWVGRRMVFSPRETKKSSSAFHPDPKTTESGWDLGERMARTGQYREGIRCLFRGVLESLESQGVLRRSDSKTNREYRDEVRRKQPDLSEMFTSLVLRFERVWYGMNQANEEDFREFYQLSHQLVCARGGGSRENH